MKVGKQSVPRSYVATQLCNQLVYAVVEVDVVGCGVVDSLAGIVDQVVERVQRKRCRFFADADEFRLELCALLYCRLCGSPSVGELLWTTSTANRRPPTGPAQKSRSPGIFRIGGGVG